MTLTVAVPKGRVLKQLIPFFKDASMPTKELEKDNRMLIREETDANIRYLLLKPDDVPTYVEYGVADLGIVGKDVLLERDYDLYAPLDLKIGRCQLRVAVPAEKESQIHQLRKLRVATKFPRLASSYFRSKGMNAETIFVQGSVELAPLTGLSDVIVDLVETGETLRQNGLVATDTILDISSFVIANRVGFKLKHAQIAPILKRLEQAVNK